jgi:hypothetical protein
MELAPDALAESRQVLADYGNMSSSTLMFALRELLAKDDWKRGSRSLSGRVWRPKVSGSSGWVEPAQGAGLDPRRRAGGLGDCHNPGRGGA